MWQNTSVIDKMYQKLAIQVSLNGLSFATFDTLTNQPLVFQKITFGTFEKNIPMEELFSNVFIKYPELNSSYDEVVVIHANNLATFVPSALFDEEYLGSYLQFNTKVFETDFYAFDQLEKHEINTVYIPYVNMNNYFIDRFGAFDYKHAYTILIEKLLAISKNNEERKMYVHVSDTQFEIVVIHNQKLELINSFEYHTPEDFIYYILFTAEQLQLNPEYFKLELLGMVNEESPLFQMAYKYVRNTVLMEINSYFNSFSEAEKREHFILLNA